MTPPRRLVVRGPNWRGDLVMAAPAIRAIGDAWPETDVRVAVPAAFASLVPLLDPRTTPVALTSGRGVGAVRTHAAQVREVAADAGLLLTNSFASALVFRLAGVPERWGYRRDGRGRLLTRAIRVKDAPRVSRHHADYYAALVQAIGLPRPALDLHVLLPAAARNEAASLLHEAGWRDAAPLLACAPGAAYGAAKQWPPRLVAEVAAGWIGDGGVVALVGAGSDRRATAEVLQTIPAPLRARVVDLTGRTSLLALAGVLGLATRVLAHDSGAMHVAAALGTPTVAVFGPTREWATAPLGPHTILTHEVWCRPCMLRECPLDHRCMTGVGADRVRAALE